MKRFLKNIGLLTMFVFLFGVSMLFVGVTVAVTMPELPVDANFMLTYFCSMIAVYGVTLFIERVAFKRVAPVYNSGHGFDPLAILLGVVLLFALSVVLLPLGQVLTPDSRSFPDGPLTLLTVVVLAPIFEEMIFRARLYNILSRNSSPLMSASLSALAFGIVHLQPIVVVEALVVGVVFSYFYLAKRSIITPIILHMCNNAFAYALVVLSYRGATLRELIGSNVHMHLVVYTICAVIVVVGTVVIIRFFVREKRRTRGIEHQDMDTIAEHYNSEQLIE